MYHRDACEEIFVKHLDSLSEGNSGLPISEQERKLAEKLEVSELLFTFAP